MSTPASGDRPQGASARASDAGPSRPRADFPALLLFAATLASSAALGYALGRGQPSPPAPRGLDGETTGRAAPSPARYRHALPMGGVISRAGDGLSRGYASEGMRPDGGDRSAGGERGPRDGRSGEPGLGAASGEAPPGIAVPPSTVRTPDPLVPEIGRLHAEILRLRVLFKRLAAVAELDDGEFDLELEPFDLPSVRDAAEGLDLSIRALDPISDLSARMAHIFDERRSAHDRRVGGRVAPGTVRTSGFGHRPNPFGGGRRELHRGVDFAGPAGTPIHALADGIVTWSGWNGGYGNLVELDHGDGMRTRYAHAESTLVALGSLVGKGQVIALLGSTGRSSGAHVHVEVRENGAPLDPARFVR